MNSSAQPSRRIASNLLWTPQGLLRNPLVGVAADGRILSVGTCPEPDRCPGTEFYAGVLAPGLVNAHCHLELSYLLGAIPERCGFAGFAGAMSQVRERFSAEQRVQAVEAADAAMWQAGIEAVGDISNGDTAFAVKSRSRIAYHTFVEFFGLRAASAEHLLPLLRHPQTSLTPHSLYSVQDAPLRAIAARGDAPLSIHFMESPGEAALFEHRGPLWEWYAKAGFSCDFLHYGSPAERLVACVPHDRRVTLVHDCCITQRDIDIVMGHFTAPVWWCLCPRSNRYISGLEPPVELLRRNRLNICLGTDSLASNDRHPASRTARLGCRGRCTGIGYGGCTRRNSSRPSLRPHGHFRVGLRHAVPDPGVADPPHPLTGILSLPVCVVIVRMLAAGR